jgi:hypothetical protein
VRSGEAAPNPPADQIQSARDEFEELLADVLGVENRTGNMIPASQLAAELGLDDSGVSLKCRSHAQIAARSAAAR